MAKKILNGIVVSNKMDKTCVVKVEKIKENPIYNKKYKVTKKYKVDDEKNQYKINDIVKITETLPISKEKKWKIIAKSEIRNSKSETKKSKKPIN